MQLLLVHVVDCLAISLFLYFLVPFAIIENEEGCLTHLAHRPGLKLGIYLMSQRNRLGVPLLNILNGR